VDSVPVSIPISPARDRHRGRETLAPTLGFVQTHGGAPRHLNVHAGGGGGEAHGEWPQLSPDDGRGRVGWGNKTYAAPGDGTPTDRGVPTRAVRP
jgi:hypothetical protein